MHVRLTGALLRVGPGPEPRAESRREGRAKGSAAEPIDLTAHPELEQAMDEFIRRAEVSWVDETIPAPGGLTPREAAADRTARPELEALLDDMAWQQRRARGGGLMDPSRIRAILGISERSR